MDTKILIEPVINKTPHGSAVQSRLFDFSLRISNRSTSPSIPFTINSVIIRSAQGQNIADDFQKKSFAVDTINPGKSVMVDVGKNGQLMFGLVAVQINLVPNDVTKTILALQGNPFSGTISEIGRNTWTDFIYIKSSSENLQEKTNIILIILTIVIAISAVIAIFPELKTLPVLPRLNLTY